MNSVTYKSLLARLLLPAGFILMLLLTCARPLASALLSNIGWLTGVRGLEKEGITVMSLAPIHSGWEVSSCTRNSFFLALAVNGKNGSASAGLGLVYAIEEKIDQSLFWLQESVKNRPNAVTLLLLGNLVQAENGDEALQYWRLAGASQYFCTLAHVRESLGDVDQALALYQRAARIDPEVDKVYLEIGRIYFEGGDFHRASDAFTVNVSLRPNRAGYAWLGRSLEVLENTDAAIQVYAQAAELGELWHGYLAIGDLYLQMGRYGHAEMWYLSAHERFPNTSLINLKLSEVALRQDQHDLAWAYIESASEQAPGDPLVAYYSGRWFYRKGDYVVASIWLEEALHRGLQGDYWFYKTLADAYYKLGTCDQAFDNYLVALQLTGTNDEQRFICARIKDLARRCEVKDSVLVETCE
jgi:tetratricopeptide (TPR) repeat protein